MRVAYVDPFSGASGDMLLGALIDAGADVNEINRELSVLGIPAARITAETVTSNGITGTRASVPPEQGHQARSWHDIRRIIEASPLEDASRSMALSIFAALAEVEATVHSIPVEDVHFHEVGALDTIVDIAGFAIGTRLLGVEQIYCGPLQVGGGTVSTAHGLLPVPAPATAGFLARAGAPIARSLPVRDDPGELLTPTGAAILCTLAEFHRPAMGIKIVGTGFGAKQLPWANICRIFIGEATSTAHQAESLMVLESNIDDMSPQFVEILLERLLSTGALDAWTTPIIMKKNRPAFTISALAQAADADTLTSLLIQQSTTLGVRRYPVSRIAADRQMESVETRWGQVRVKLKIWTGRVIDLAPEYDDCARIAREQDIAVRDIWNEAYQIGRVFIGRRVDAPGKLARLDPIEPGDGR